MHDNCKKESTIHNLPAVRWFNETNVNASVVFFGVIFKHGCRTMSYTTKNIPQLLTEVADVGIQWDLMEKVVKEQGGSVFCCTQGRNSWVPLLNYVTSLLYITRTIKIYNINHSIIVITLQEKGTVS